MPDATHAARTWHPEDMARDPSKWLLLSELFAAGKIEMEVKDFVDLLTRHRSFAEFHFRRRMDLEMAERTVN